MKQNIFKKLMLIALLLTSNAVWAYDFESGGIYYYLNGNNTATVTCRDGNYNSYTGDIVIPETVTKEDVTYSVTSIGEYAFYYCTGLTSVTIGNSVTSIGSYAFYECSGLTSVTIGNSVTSIGNRAFYKCSGLTSVTIPNSVTSIGEYAFYYCDGLTSVTIPNSVTSIGNYAFSGCSGLTSVTIPNSVTSIGGGAFSGCSGLTSVTIPNSVTSISEYTFSGCSGLTSVTIPNSVTSISEYTFSGCSGLTSVTISEGVTSIGNSAFYGCTGLTYIELPSTITSIGGSAFAISHYYYDENGKYNYRDNITRTIKCNTKTPPTLGDNVFDYNNLTLEVPFESIPDYQAVEGWTKNSSGSLTYKSKEVDGIYYLPTSKTEVAVTFKDKNYNSYTGDIVIPSEITVNDKTYNVTSIGISAFHRCIDLTSVVIPKGVTSIGYWAFYYCSSLSNVTIPNSVNSINYEAFYHCTSLKNVTIPESVTSISNGAFSGCNSLIEIAIPEGVISIGNYAFRGCRSLTSVTLPESLISIGSHAFSDCAFTSITIPKNVTSIGEYALANPNNIKEVNCEAIVPPALEGTSLTGRGDTQLNVPFESVLAYKEATYWKDIFSYYGGHNIDGLYYLPTSENEVAVSYKDRNYNSYSGDVIIPSEINVKNKTYKVSSIGEYAFYGCHDLTSVIIGENVKSMAHAAFHLWLDHKLTKITSLAITPPLFECYNDFIKNISLTVPFESIITYKEAKGWKEFQEYTSLDVEGIYYMPTSETEVEVTFKDKNYNSYTNDVVIPSEITVNDKKYKVTSIGNRAFYNCESLTNVTIPESVIFIGNDAFNNCDSLYSVTIPNSVTSIGSYAFNDCSNLTNATISDGVTLISDYAFYKCRSLTSLTIPNNVTAIGIWAFYDCESLTNLTIPNNVTSIGDNAFSYCRGLTNVTFESTIPPTIGAGAFIGIYYAATFKTPFASILTYKALEELKDKTFASHEVEGFYYMPTSETEVEVTSNPSKYSGDVVIPSEITVDEKKYNVTSIAGSAFSNCIALTNITIPESVTSIGSSAFYRCNSLPGILEIPSRVTEIGSNAFYGTKTKIFRMGAVTPQTISSNSLSNEVSLVLVPVGSVDAYKAVDVWANYKTDKYNIIAEGACDVEVTNETAGKLTTAIRTQAKKNLNNITSLKVHGTLNADDFEKINTNMTSLLHLDLSDTDVTEIIAETFKDKPTLMSVKLPNGLKSIGNNAFSGCSVLSKELIFPETLETIGNFAFSGCSLLTCDITIPTSVTSIGNNVFVNCTGIQKVDMTKSTNLTSISSYAFSGCTSLQTVILPEPLTKIENNSFYNCTNLNNVTLPASLETIGSSAFYGCTGLSSIEFSYCGGLTTINSSAFYGCTGLSLLDLSACESLTAINNSAFSGCSALETINFPSSLATLGASAFANCSNLTEMSVPCTVPPTIENNANPFANVDNIACILSIPTDNFDDYYDANYWGGFVDIEKKSEIQIEVNKPTDDEIDDDDNEKPGIGNDDDNGHGHKWPYKGCYIFYKKFFHHNGGKPTPHALALKSFNKLADTESTISGETANAVTASGQSLIIGYDESVTFYLTPEDGKEIESVIFNDEDVTSQLVNNTYTATVTSDMVITNFVVTLKNASTTLAGDVNGDGEVNVTDITTLISYILGNTEGVNSAVVDINNDGEVNVTDVTTLISMILGTN